MHALDGKAVFLVPVCLLHPKGISGGKPELFRIGIGDHHAPVKVQIQISAVRHHSVDGYILAFPLIIHRFQRCNTVLLCTGCVGFLGGLQHILILTD